MKLAFAIFRYFPFGGLQRDMLAIAQEAVQRGHNVTVFCGAWDGERPANIDVVIAQAPVRFDTAGVKSFARGFEQVFQRQDFDLLVGFNKMPGLDIYFCGDSCFAKKAYEERNILYRLAPRSRLYLANEKAVYDRFSTTKILQLTDAEQLTLMRYYGTSAQRFHPLPPGISLTHALSQSPPTARQKIRAEFGITEQDTLLLCVGSGFKTKGLDRSIEIVAQLAHSYGKQIRLLIVGEDKSQPFKRQAQSLGLADQVYFAGGRTDIADIYQAADLLLHPAYREAAGNVLLEAMVAALPVLATDICGYAHYIQKYGIGSVITAPYSITEMAQQADKLLQIEKPLWRERAAILQRDSSLFSRPQAALAVIEECAAATTPAIEQTRCSADQQLILRAELIAWAQQNIFEQVEHLQGHVARAVAERETLRFEWQGAAYYRKLHRGVGWREVLKNLLCLRWPVTGARNEWDALNALPLVGIKTLTPVAFGEQRAPVTRRKSFLITRELTDVIQLDHHMQQAPGFAERRNLTTAVAKIARRLHGAGINHRDLYLCHFMLATATPAKGLPQTEPEIYLMDLHRAQWRRQVPRRWLIKDIGSLYYSALVIGVRKRDIYQFLRVYFNQPLAEIFSRHRALLVAIEARARKIYRRDLHTDPAFPVRARHG